MDKIKLDKPVFLYPMPMTIVGAIVDGKPNWLAVAWVTPANYDPLYLGIALGRSHRTSRGIREHGAFSVNIPGTDLLAVTDYIGLNSGSEVDKSQLFSVFTGTIENVPMIAGCPVTFECRLVQTVELPVDDFFIGEVVGAWSEQRFLTVGVPDIQKIRPFTLTMPDNRYWSVGPCVGKAWFAGKEYKKSELR
jgi:flavin reductase (DIM6/NTAB) family NADH-FMN oxidoreductase RutF